MNNNKTMKYNKTQEINYKKKRKVRKIEEKPGGKGRKRAT